jgi:Cu2+-containing amine oxidase
MGAKALWVGPVEMRFAGGPWTTILYQAGLADIFVPYHVDTNARFYDLNQFAPLDAVTSQDAGPNGSLITLTNETHPTVVAETRDRGIGWLCKGTTQASYRSHEYVIWSVSDAGNYDNIVQYSFRDDGSIGFRMGNTGYNSPTHMLEAHMHNGLWRVDMDLKGSAGDSALWSTHNEPLPPSYGSVGLLRALDSDAYMGVEGARSVSPTQFASLEIQDSSVNAYGHHPAYEFHPFEEGVSRHYGPNDGWTQNDAYVTVYHSNELGFTTNSDKPDAYLLGALSGELVTNNDLVVWIKASAHHEPSDEDRSPNDIGTNLVTGVTGVHWSGFDAEPHNFFNYNPMGAPVRCGS